MRLTLLYFHNRLELKIKNYIYFLVTLLFIGISSCLTDKKDNSINENLKEIALVKESSLSYFGNNIFFQNIGDIDKYENRYFFLDDELNRILLTDLQLNYLSSFIKEGGASYEAKSLGKMTTIKDSLFISDLIKSKVMVFDINGNFSRSFQIGLLGIGEFMTDKESIYIFNDDYNYRTNPISKISHSGRKISNFGKASNQFLNNPDRHLVDFSPETLLSVYAENKPMVELYSKTGQLIKAFDLSQLDLFKHALNYYNLEIKNDPNLDLVLVPDLQTIDSSLYLLISNMDQFGEWFSHTILECNIRRQANEIIPKRILSLNKDHWYETFFVDRSKSILIAFNTTEGDIELYKLP